MKFLTTAAFIFASVTNVNATTGTDGPRYDADKLKAYLDGSYQIAATTCFGTGEQTSGMNKICFYDCLGSAFAITIGATQLCPLTIKRQMSSFQP